jgi:hypothetical protein
MTLLKKLFSRKPVQRVRIVQHFPDPAGDEPENGRRSEITASRFHRRRAPTL